MNELRQIGVLDHGYVRLVEFMGSDLSVVRSARVSYNAEWRAGEDQGSDIRLINYLMKNKHTSPFEAVSMTFEVKAPIFVFRQWHRHRTFSYNEISARYSQLPDEFYLPEPTEVGIQSTDNKQVRTLRTDWTSEEAKDELRRSEEVVDLLRDTNRAAFETYKQLLKRGVPRELARTVLPVATYSKMFATVNLHNLFRFLKLRLHPHAQVEIRRYAEALLQLAMRVAPHSVTAFINTELATYGYDQKYTQG
jgi:thymidylate synthase (FAD)